MTRLQSSSKRKVRNEESDFFFYRCLLAHVWCFYIAFPPPKRRISCVPDAAYLVSGFVSCSSCVFSRMSCSLCLFCSLFLILKIVLLLVLFTRFPVPSECSYTSLCLLWRSRCSHSCAKCHAIAVLQTMLITVFLYA